MSTPNPQHLLDLALHQVSTHALILQDPHGNIVAWLGRAQRLFGYTPEAILGQHASALFTPEDLKQHIPAWEPDTASTAPESEDDRWMVRKDGARFWVNGTLTALRDDRGNLLGFAKIMRNRTDQKLQFETLEAQIH